MDNRVERQLMVSVSKAQTINAKSTLRFILTIKILERGAADNV